MRKVELERDSDGRVVMPGADLPGADLRWASLRGAKLTGAYLRGADLRGADLAGAGLAEADLRWADLRGADLRGAEFRAADLEGAIGIDEVPRTPMPGLAARVLEQITGHPESLDMGEWHSGCGTKHCFAGWAVALAGEAGEAAEGRLGTASAASLLLGGSEHPFEGDGGDKVIPWLEARVREEESNAES